MFFGRNASSEELTRDLTVDAQGATSAHARLDMSAGTLHLRGGASTLMDGHFEFNEGMEPRVHYDLHDGRGELRIDQPNRRKPFRVTRNRWDVRLTDTIPLDVEVDNAAGQAQIDASTLALTSFVLRQAAGEADVHLNGDQLRLARVNVDMSAGRLDLGLRGAYPVLRELRVDSTAGQLRLDLTGEWVSEVQIKVSVAAGEAIVRLPKTVNVLAQTRTGIGQVKARGLVLDGKLYRQDVSGAAGTLRLDVDASVGQVVLEVVD